MMTVDCDPDAGKPAVLPVIERYAGAVAVHVGTDEPEDRLHHRCRLLAARDWAARKISNSEYIHPEAYALYQSIHAHAGAWCFRIVTRREDVGGIERAASNCTKLAQVASSIEAMEAAYG